MLPRARYLENRRRFASFAGIVARPYTWLMQHRFASVLAALTLVACNNAIIVQLQTGAQTFDVAASSLDLPAALRDDSSGTARVSSVDCSSTGICPSTTEVPVDCNAGVCDPAAISVSVPVGDVVDFDELLNSASTLLRLVDAIEIESVTYDVNPNSLTMDLPATTVLWGPASATETSANLQPIGTIPTITHMEMSSGMMDIDQNGSAALSDYLVHTARQVRFFARTSVDLNPGDPFPDGMAQITVNIRVRAIGRIVN
jgi:hypothetical protein